METRTIGQDVVLSFDPVAWTLESQVSRDISGSGHSLTGAIIPTQSDASEGSLEWIQRRVTSDPTVVIQRLPTLVRLGDARKRGAPIAPPVIDVELSSAESAVVLLEADGVVSWHFQEEEAPSTPPADRAAPFQRRARFRLDPTAPRAGNASGRRDLISDWMIGRVKAVVLKFVAHKAAGKIVAVLERSTRTGPVIIGDITDPERWALPRDFSSIKFKADHGRILLLVHGTFSSTAGGFGELCATSWGRALLAEASTQYDAIVGYDHRTLSVDPMENARGLYEALQTLPTETDYTIDIICHSRGGLVTRCLIEKILPNSSWRPRIGPVIFAGATNAGTKLARPDNWNKLLDLMTNLALVGRKALMLLAPQVSVVSGAVIDSVADFVRYLVEAAVKDRQVPGLAAMDPDGEFIKGINTPEAGAPKAADVKYYVIRSNFQPVVIDQLRHEPKEFVRPLALMLANGFIDALMEKVANDLVVHVDSMGSIDAAAGNYVKEICDFGTNAVVYHTNYFIQPESVDSIARWLELASPSAVDTVMRGNLETNFMIWDEGAKFSEVFATTKLRAPKYVIVRGEDPETHHSVSYVLSAREVSRHASDDQQQALREVLRLDSRQRALTVTEPQMFRSLETRTHMGNGVHDEMHRGTIIFHDEDQKPAGILLEHQKDGAIDFLVRAAKPNAHQLREPRSRYHGPKSAITAGAQPPPPPYLPMEDRVVCHVRADMTEHVRVESVARITVTLSAIALAVTEGVASAGASALLELNRKVIVEVLPRVGFKLMQDCDLQSSRVELSEPPRPDQTAVIDFELMATHAGEGEVWIIVRQGSLRALTLTLRPQIVGDEAATAVTSELTAAAEFSAPLSNQSEVPTLEISQQRNGNEIRFRFTVDVPRFALNRYESAPLNTDIESFVNHIYKGIEQAWLGSNANLEIFHDSLKAKGYELFGNLLPAPLKDQLWQLHQAGKLKSLLVRSDEPFMPWEIVYIDDPHNPGQRDGCFFAELGLCRWLYGAVPAERIRIRPDRCFYIVPHYPEPRYRLAAAEEIEEPMLCELGFKRIEPHYFAVREALESRDIDCLHFAGHGIADSARITDAQLWLEGSHQVVRGGNAYVTEPLTASLVAMHSKLRRPDGARALVMVNACQAGRGGFSLTSIGGFAPAFLGIQNGARTDGGEAGAFIGSLWSVYDEPASHFARGFYEAAHSDGGCTIGEAVAAGRAAARKAGDATWLSYVVYADPNCHIEFLPRSE